jgi:hypothetical protein
MKRTALILATVAAVGTAAVSSPAEARWGRGLGWGPGIGFGIAAGVLTAGAIAASRPYYWGPGYGYYGPRYYRPRITRAPMAITGPAITATARVITAGELETTGDVKAEATLSCGGLILRRFKLARKPPERIGLSRRNVRCRTQLV